MTRKFVIFALIGALSAACGDDDDDGGASPEIVGVCQSSCERADECGLLEASDLSMSECKSACEDANTELTKDCKFTAAEADACGDAYKAQSCDDFGTTVPDECFKTCMVSGM